MKHSKILEWALILALIIVLNLFFHFATKVVYQEPTWDTYCPQKQVNISPSNEKDCVAVGGAWNAPASFGKEPRSYPAVASLPVEPQGYCDVTFTCAKEYNEVHKVYNRNVFIVLIVLGLLSLGAGFWLTQSGAVSLGVSFGGVVSLIVGSTRYWSDMNDYLRLIMLAVALIVLIWLGIKKLSQNQ